MSTTQRSESMNAFFDGYVNSKTTLKQFVEQYENALKDKAEKEKENDLASCNKLVVCWSDYEMEKQFQDTYTNNKFKELQEDMKRKMYCRVSSSKEDNACSECQVTEDIKIFGELRHWLNREADDGVDINCTCKLFEFRGIVCRHCITVLTYHRFENISQKYILQRWRKNLKRNHTKVRVSYDNWNKKPEGKRFNKLCKCFYNIADLATDSDALSDKLMVMLKDLEIEFKESVEADQKMKPANNTFKENAWT